MSTSIVTSNAVADSVGAFDLWVQAFESGHGFEPTVSIAVKFRHDGAYNHTTVMVPVDVAWRLGELLQELQSRKREQAQEKLVLATLPSGDCAWLRPEVK